MSWLYLIVAGVFEAGWLICIHKSESFSKLPFVVMAVCSMAISLLLFALSLKDIPVSIAYLVWLAVGGCSLVVVNHFFFAQTLSPAQLLFLMFILVGVAGVKWYS